MAWVLRWLMVPLCLAAPLNWAVQSWTASRQWDWMVLDTVDGSNRPDILILGSSRVAAAIDEKQLADQLAAPQGGALRVWNVSAAWSTLQEQAMALRNLLSRCPESLRGCIVLIEAPGGLPEPVPAGPIAPSWAGGRWFNDRNPQTILPLLRWEDIPAACRARMPIEDRAYLCFFAIIRPLALFCHHDRVHAGVARRGEEWLTQILPAAPQQPPSLDLVSRAGIRTDSASARLHWEMYTEWVARAVRQQTSIDWEQTAAGALVRMVREHGGRVVFFRMPLHSLPMAAYRTPTRLADHSRLLNYLDEHGGGWINPPIVYADHDFPDLAHLSKSRQAEFTAALADGLTPSVHVASRRAVDP